MEKAILEKSEREYLVLTEKWEGSNGESNTRKE